MSDLFYILCTFSVLHVFDPVWCKRVKYKHLYWKNGILCLLIWCGLQLCVFNETSWLDDDNLANEFSVERKEGSPVVFFVLHKVSEDADKSRIENGENFLFVVVMLFWAIKDFIQNGLCEGISKIKLTLKIKCMMWFYSVVSCCLINEWFRSLKCILNVMICLGYVSFLLFDRSFRVNWTLQIIVCMIWLIW